MFGVKPGRTCAQSGYVVVGGIRRYSLKRPQYNFKEIKVREAELQRSVENRNVVLPGKKSVNEIIGTYDKYVKTGKLWEYTRRQQKLFQVPFQDKQLMKDPRKVTNLRRKLALCKDKLKEFGAQMDAESEPAFEGIEALPNFIDSDSIDLTDNKVVEFINPHVTPFVDSELDHLQIATNLGLVDFESAAEVSGSSWYYLTNDGALLEMALVQYALKKAIAKGWAVVTPPAVVRTEYSNACGFKPRDEADAQQVYMIPDNGLCLTGTAEIPLAAMAAGKTLAGPHTKVVGVNKSYRAEAGARGKDTRGLYRVHEFTKVELFAWAQGLAESESIHTEILQLEKEIISELGLHARVLQMAPFDLGAPAYKKYDIEAWMPGRGEWGEVTSASNCLDYQSRRLHTKMTSTEGEVGFAHTLNGTAMAVPRMMVALIENNYDKDTNRILIPEVLREYMGKEYIVKSQSIF